MKFFRWLSWSRSCRRDATPLRARRELPRFRKSARRRVTPCVATILPDPMADQVRFGDGLRGEVRSENHAAAKAHRFACAIRRQVLFRFLFRLSF